ncbi:MAG: hypothetical protein KZQ61_17060, partial [Candidatus Thiodiazotropha sp. (ex Lucinoma aequizonata)]|nr:hypothetical protein [Candidatus Thiodiazotropha sp. (ex Lucinoma aequizonata)]
MTSLFQSINESETGYQKVSQRSHSADLLSARQKTHFFREPVLPHLVISGLIINTGAIFFCRRIKNDNNFYLWRLQVIPAPAALAAGLVHASQAALFLRPRFRC